MSRILLETLVSRQLHQYNRLRGVLRARAGEAPVDDDGGVPGPVVTISRMAGCCARDLAGAVAAEQAVRLVVDLVAARRQERLVARG